MKKAKRDALPFIAMLVRGAGMMNSDGERGINPLSARHQAY